MINLINDNLKNLQNHLEKSNRVKTKMLEYKKFWHTSTFHVFDQFLINVHMCDNYIKIIYVTKQLKCLHVYGLISTCKISNKPNANIIISQESHKDSIATCMNDARNCHR